MLATAISFAGASPAGVRPTADSTDILRLTDPDAGVRALARNHLSDSTARLADQLSQAAQSDDPELRQQTALLMLGRQWTEPGDDDMVVQLLSNYATLDAETRADQIDLLIGLQNDAGRPAVIRILRYDPSAAVRWAAMSALRMHGPETAANAIAFAAKLLARDGRIDPTINVPLQALAGWTLRDSNPTQAERLLESVVDAEAEHPTAVRGQLDAVFLWLIDRAMAAGRDERALSLLRQQARQQLWDGRSLPDSIGSILSLHAAHGPFQGLRDDANSASGYWDRPELMYCAAQAADRSQMPVVAAVIRGISMASSGISSEAHETVGSFLLAQGWVDLAEREFNAAVWLSGGQSIDAWFDLSRVAAVRDDEFGVATNLQEGLRRMSGQQLHRTSRFGEITPWADRDAWAEVHWHFLRAAMRANDNAAVGLHLNKLIELNKLETLLASSPWLAADIVPALRTLGRNAEADRCFAVAFKIMHDAVTALPNDGEPLNNLAWLCACAGEHLKEAEEWSDRAVAAKPAQAAFLDTAAEVRFRNGHARAAAELESKALAITPQDQFMRRQLALFRAAATTEP